MFHEWWRERRYIKKIGSDIMCSGWISSSCSTNDTCHVFVNDMSIMWYDVVYIRGTNVTIFKLLDLIYTTLNILFSFVKLHFYVFNYMWIREYSYCTRNSIYSFITATIQSMLTIFFDVILKIIRHELVLFYFVML